MKTLILSSLIASLLLPLALQGSQAMPEIVQKISLSVVAPNGGEVWVAGEKRSIGWKAVIGPRGGDWTTLRGAADYVKAAIAPVFLYAPMDIVLIRTGDPSYNYQIATVNLYDSEYVWLVSENIPNGGDYQIKIVLNGQWLDISDGTFTVKNSQCSVAPELAQKIREQLRQMEAALNQLQSQINYLKSVLENL